MTIITKRVIIIADENERCKISRIYCIHSLTLTSARAEGSGRNVKNLNDKHQNNEDSVQFRDLELFSHPSGPAPGAGWSAGGADGASP